ncbi:hypothetical protein ARC78_08070 [Stenotrophomonas pictorum JCM 9942]|uniref:Uncharacterized protein n=2 Tax=Stenotrophomonas pictorum TaxID=86184 RepID=A0A0R0AS47_9GAMM|nr:hypothetical protein [Stenotrophomonas pictorum]KRG42931.1 hypothetical protein ARC78_08070 [Stenotrophomonas pictorum JCM 9942]
MQEAYETIRDNWLSKKEYAALVKAIVGNWTSGNCVEYMRPLTAALVAEEELELHRHLWTRTLKRQLSAFFREYSFIRRQRLPLQDIASTDSSGFDEFDYASYSDHRKAASFLLGRIYSSLAIWRDELIGAGLSTEDPDNIVASLQLLKQPRIDVNRLPPNNSFKPNWLRQSA